MIACNLPLRYCARNGWPVLPAGEVTSDEQSWLDAHAFSRVDSRICGDRPADPRRNGFRQTSGDVMNGKAFS